SITSEAASRRNSGMYLFLTDIVHNLSSRAKPDKLNVNKTRITPPIWILVWFWGGVRVVVFRGLFWLVGGKDGWGWGGSEID
ncbi:hypothetical protein, partial [Mobiluncus mulieris]